MTDAKKPPTYAPLEHTHEKADAARVDGIATPSTHGGRATASIPPWGKAIALLAALAAAFGITGLFTDANLDDPLTQPDPHVMVRALPTLNGMWVTYTPTPTVEAAAENDDGARTPVIVREILGTPPTAAAPIVSVVTVIVVTEPLMPVAVSTPAPTREPRATRTPVPEPTQCVLPPGLCRRESR